MIAESEGTTRIGDQDGYNVIAGGTTFDGYTDHPRKLVVLNKAGLKSTAAGRYQLLSRYYDVYKKLLKLPASSSVSQDAIVIQQIRECKALGDVDAGRFDIAVKKCARIWASLPGAGYGQHENKLADLRIAYVNACGTLVA